jgi:hypothetical protein
LSFAVATTASAIATGAATPNARTSRRPDTRTSVMPTRRPQPKWRLGTDAYTLVSAGSAGRGRSATAFGSARNAGRRFAKSHAAAAAMDGQCPQTYIQFASVASTWRSRAAR